MSTTGPSRPAGPLPAWLMASPWTVPAILTGALAVLVAVVTGRVAFYSVASPPLLTYPWLGPVLVLLAGPGILLVAAFWRRGAGSFDTSRMLPLLLMAGVVLNTWWVGPRALLRTPGNTLGVLFTQPQDAFGNMAVYVRIAELFAGRRFVASPDTLRELELVAWELRAYGRVGEVVGTATPAAISDAERERLLRRSHDVVRVQALGFKDGRYFSYLRTFVLVGDDGQGRGSITVATHGNQAFILPAEWLGARDGGQ